MRAYGILLIIAGGILALWAMFVFDTSVPASSGVRVNNLGLMADRQNLIISGWGILIAGLLMYLFGAKNQSESEQMQAIRPPQITFRTKPWLGVRDLKDDAYQIYLLKKYRIEKNEVLGKYVANNRSFISLEDALSAMSELDATAEIEHLTSKDYIKSKGKIGLGLYEYTEYGDGTVIVIHPSGVAKEFKTIFEAKMHFDESS